MGRDEALEAFVAEYSALDELVGSLGRDELLVPSGCRGWSNVDLVFHLLLDAQRALVTFNSPSEGPPDRDFITYWEGFQATDESSLAHARFVRESAAAHSDPQKLCHRWQETARAAIRCSTTALQAEYLTTQGHVLRTEDLLATLTVEACIHHLDLLANLEERDPPAARATALTIKTLEGLLGHPKPADWDDTAFILKVTGRRLISKQDEKTLGAPGRVPLFS